MASVRKTTAGNWEVRWKTPDHQTRKRRFASKPEAMRFKTEVEHQVLSQSYVDPSAGRVTFKVYAEQWRSAQVHRAGTESQVRLNLENHVYPRLGSRPIGSIRRSEIQALVTELSQTLAPSTVTVVVSWVRSIFKSAVADRVIACTPCTDVKVPTVAQPKVVPLTATKVLELVGAMPDRYKTLVVLGAGTGVRISEALGLTQDRVNWQRKYVTIDRQLSRGSGKEVVFGPVKDRRNRGRTIPLPDVVLAALVEHVRVFGLGPEGLIFTNEKNEPVRQTTFSDVWRAAAGPLGIPTGSGFHLLRHFYASVLIQEGESVKVIQDRLGHTSAQMTLDIYGHLWPENDDRTRAAVDSVLGAIGARLEPALGKG